MPRGAITDADYTPSVPEPGAKPATPMERLRAYLWAQWCAAASKTTRQCYLCKWPVDEPFNEFVPSGPIACKVCTEMLSALHARSYWVDLEAREARAKRNMGIE